MSPTFLKDCFLWKRLHFSAHILCNLKKCKYLNCEYYIYIFVSEVCYTEHGSYVYVTYEVNKGPVAVISACVKLWFLIFSCKFYETCLQCAEKKWCRINMGRGQNFQPVSHVYLLYNKCMKMEIMENKGNFAYKWWRQLIKSMHMQHNTVVRHFFDV